MALLNRRNDEDLHSKLIPNHFPLVPLLLVCNHSSTLKTLSQTRPSLLLNDLVFIINFDLLAVLASKLERFGYLLFPCTVPGIMGTVWRLSTTMLLLMMRSDLLDAHREHKVYFYSLISTNLLSKV